ncbi:uncharacterized protein G2W53_026557 [Senna tora]|uniref:Uncharacterized protein n=1 Tax=Senna tora TaxID=362788 RepID=A0A834TH73_9FABA|nr:uncharacterized protein G2W53_026557 [Senna tora]
MKEVRLDWKKGQRPAWMPKGCLHELGNIWLTEDYQEKQQQNKQNRASTRGGSLHTCGSITISEHKRRICSMFRLRTQTTRNSSNPIFVAESRTSIGKEPYLPELFLKTHKKKDTGQFVDKRSVDVVEQDDDQASE